MKEQYLIWCFIGVFLTVYFVEAIAGFYMTTNIVNLERQFQIPSKISGLMVSASDFGYIPTVIFISFIGSKSNRAKFIGGGCMLIAIANIMIGYSHFLFPTPTASMTSFRVESILERDLNRWSNDSVTVQDFLTYLKNYNGGVGIGNLNSIMGKNPLQILNQGSQQQIIALSNTTKIGFVKSIDVSQEKNELLRMFKSTFFYCNSPTSQDDQLCISYFAFLREYNNVDPIELSEYRQLIHSSYAYCDMGLNQMKNISHDLKCAENTSSMQPTILIFAGLIILGIGRTVPFSLGLPLVDDNIAKRNLSTFYAFMFIIRILGPSLAFAIGSIVNTKYYIDDVPPGMTVRDPNWIGAWYIGFFLIGCGLFVPSLIMFLFPSGSSDKTDGNEVEMETFVDGKKVKPKSKPKLHLVDKHLKKNKKGVVKPPMTISSTIREFTSAMGECFKKPVFVAITIGKTIDVFAFKGFFLFLNKYLEIQFDVPQYLANKYIGIYGISGFASGTIIGSIIMRVYKLEGRKAAGYILIFSTLGAFLTFLNSQTGCESTITQLSEMGAKNNFNFANNTCISDCGCEGVTLYPVCDISGNPYYSPCNAGCPLPTNISSILTDDKSSTTELIFNNCTCTKDNSETVSRKYCHVEQCSTNLVYFFINMCISGFFGGLAVVPSVMIGLRAVAPEHRSIALGFQGFIVSLVATLPSPTFWGAVIDSNCRFWNKTCDGEGACIFFDTHNLRFYLYVTYGCIRILSLISDVMVYIYGKDIQLAVGLEDDVADSDDEEENTKELDPKVDLTISDTKKAIDL